MSESQASYQIFSFLISAIGVPYLLLSSNGPLLQTWFKTVYPKRSPYRLYSISNLGSLLALVSYPFIVEPLFKMKIQGIIWTISFSVFVLLNICLALQFLAKTRAPAYNQPDEMDHCSKEKDSAQIPDITTSTRRLADLANIGGCRTFDCLKPAIPRYSGNSFYLASSFICILVVFCYLFLSR